MTTETDLLPCPFCKGTKIVLCHDDGVYWNRCTSCGATGPTCNKRQDDDAPEWNTRTPPESARGDEVIKKPQKRCAYCERVNAICYKSHHKAEQQKTAEPDLTKCPQCGGPADNGHDRCFPPNPYNCTKCDPPAQDAGELEIPDGYALVEKEYLRHVGVHADKWLDHLKHVEEAVISAPDGLEKDIARLIEVTQPNQMRDEYRLAIKRIIAAARAKPSVDAGELINELADDLEAEIRNRYEIDGEIHPAEQRHFDRDMDVVIRARAHLESLRGLCTK